MYGTLRKIIAIIIYILIYIYNSNILKKLILLCFSLEVFLQFWLGCCFSFVLVFVVNIIY